MAGRGGRKVGRKPMIKPTPPPPPPPPKAPLLCLLSSLLLTLTLTPTPPSRCTQAFLSGAAAAYPSQSCGAIFGAFYPNTGHPPPPPPSSCLIEPRTVDVREGPQGRQIKSSSGGRLEPLCFMCPPHSSCRGSSGNSFVWSRFFLKTRIFDGEEI